MRCPLYALCTGGVFLLEGHEVKPRPCGQRSMTTGAGVCQQEPCQATRTRSMTMGANECQQEPCQATAAREPQTVSSPHARARLTPAELIRGVANTTDARPNSCTWDPRPTVRERCPRRAMGGNRGEHTVPHTTEVIGDLRRGRMPRYRCGEGSRSSHIPVGRTA